MQTILTARTVADTGRFSGAGMGVGGYVRMGVGWREGVGKWLLGRS